MAQRVKNLPAKQETQVQSLGWEDPLEEENGTPLQYPYLKNPTDRAILKGGAKSLGTWREEIEADLDDLCSYLTF